MHRTDGYAVCTARRVQDIKTGHVSTACDGAGTRHMLDRQCRFHKVRYTLYQSLIQWIYHVFHLYLVYIWHASIDYSCGDVTSVICYADQVDLLCTVFIFIAGFILGCFAGLHLYLLVFVDCCNFICLRLDELPFFYAYGKNVIFAWVCIG